MGNPSRAMFLVCAVSVAVVRESCSALVASRLLMKNPTVDGDALGSLLFERLAASPVMCAVICKSTADCRFVAGPVLSTSPSSVFCRGYALPTTGNVTTAIATTTATPTTNAPSSPIAVWVLQESSWLEKPCTNDSECGGGKPMVECFAGSCLCRPGYYYSLTWDSCLQPCPLEHLQQRVLAYPGKRVRLNNIRCILSLTLDGCRELCSLTPEARTCDYLFYATNTHCCLQSVTKLDIEYYDWKDDPLTTHFQKTCL